MNNIIEYISHDKLKFLEDIKKFSGCFSSEKFPESFVKFIYDASENEGWNLVAYRTNKALYLNEDPVEEILGEYKFGETTSLSMLLMPNKYTISLNSLDEIGATIITKLEEADNSVSSLSLQDKEEVKDNLYINNYRYSISKSNDTCIIDKGQPVVKISRDKVEVGIIFYPEYGLVIITNIFPDQFRGSDWESENLMLDIILDYFTNNSSLLTK